MKVVQQAGNTLSEKVEQIGQLSLRGRMEQEEKNVAMKNMVTQLDKDITQLQSDVVDQNEINHIQKNKITYLERVVEAMDDRLTKFEARLSEVEDIV